ncbi:MAG: hypothetical protein J5648_00830 [Lachnospiraceae bacterium]|nr:hypothetical protein [Lachnospiraceae bacterium]
MRIKRAVLMAFSIMMMCFILTGCKEDTKNKEDLSNVAERWAYSHETDKAVLILYKDGTASFNGIKYKSYEVTDKSYKFTAEDGTVTEHRYYDGKDFDGQSRRYIYRKMYYQLVPDLLTGDSPVIGYWQGVGEYEKLSYQFTDKGTFYEDETLPGHYFVDEDEGSILLSYDGYLSNTLIYYSIDGDKMTVDYPWGMVQMP